MEKITCRVSKTSLDFLDSAVSDATSIVVELPRNPDPRIERYSGNTSAPFTAKTAKEIAAFDRAQQAALDKLHFTRSLKAVAAVLYKDAHGAFPNATQAANLQADFLLAMKAL